MIACNVILLVLLAIIIFLLFSIQKASRKKHYKTQHAPVVRFYNKRGSYYDDNTLAYVALHEAAHTLVSSIGHGWDFEETFAELLKKAERGGYYDPKKKIDPAYPRSKIAVKIT